MRRCRHILQLLKACQTFSKVSQSLSLCLFSPWKGLFSKPKIGKNIWLFTFQYHFCFHLFSMLWGSASRFFRGEASHFCCSWVFFVCVACPTYNFLSFTSLVWVQAVVEITSCLGNFANFSRFASPGLKQVKSVWDQNFSLVTSWWHRQKMKKVLEKISQ